MAYQYYDVNGNEIKYHDLQDKSHWCKDGERLEEAFVRTYGSQLGVTINPEKSTNPYAPDLLTQPTNIRGDLKLQSTPFFTSPRYGIDPTYAVVFNLKDKDRYENNYPEIDIYYWVNWIPIRYVNGGYEVSVEPISGVWRVSFEVFNNYLKSAPVHSYQQRVNDQKGNAKASFVCDIRDKIFERLI